MTKYMSKKSRSDIFSKQQKTTSKSIKDLNAEQDVDASWFSTRKPTYCNIHIYHFHILESPHLDFFKFWGRGTN